MYSRVKADVKKFFEVRNKANEELYTTLSEEMLVDYQNVKKNLDSKLQALKEPPERLKMMAQWLRETQAVELLEAAKIFESEGDYILKRLWSPEKKWDSFLSHVQKDASDVCRNIKESLNKEGITIWYDKLADRIDNRGMTDGVINSNLFTFVLTKDYFKRPYCVYEYCLAIVAQKPIIAVLESDARFGGGPVDSFNLEGIFKHVLSHEIIEIHRTYWDAFIKYLHQRIEMTLKPNSAKLIKFGDKDVQPTNSKPHLEIENSQLSTDMSFVGGKDPLHGLIPKSQVSIEEKKKDVCESLGIKSYILEEEEM